MPGATSRNTGRTVSLGLYLRTRTLNERSESRMKKDYAARLAELSATDREIWSTGRAFAGIDEAGRGLWRRPAW